MAAVLRLVCENETCTNLVKQEMFLFLHGMVAICTECAGRLNEEREIRDSTSDAPGEGR